MNEGKTISLFGMSNENQTNSNNNGVLGLSKVTNALGGGMQIQPSSASSFGKGGLMTSNLINNEDKVSNQ